jgi:hypothetical protein
MHVDVGPRTGWGSSLAMTGVARDLRTGRHGEAPEVMAEARVEAEFDGERKLDALRCRPDAPFARELLGARAGGGFRRRLEEVVPVEEQRSLLRQVLDDMPAAALISGYGFMRLARRQGLEPSSLTPPNMLSRMTDLCSGWRAGGTATESVVAGHGVPLQDCPPAPDLGGEGEGEIEAGDRWAFHHCGHLPVDAMRRRRCLDVSPDGDGTIGLWAMFRDSVGEPDGGEAVLHEYALAARVEDGFLTAVEAEPRVLPFPECPAAADKVGVLVGVALADVAASVPALIAGTDCCTHLNDLLRALGGVAGLVAQLTA